MVFLPAISSFLGFVVYIVTAFSRCFCRFCTVCTIFVLSLSLVHGRFQESVQNFRFLKKFKNFRGTERKFFVKIQEFLY
jgi:hypothetical protein